MAFDLIEWSIGHLMSYTPNHTSMSIPTRCAPASRSTARPVGLAKVSDCRPIVTSLTLPAGAKSREFLPIFGVCQVYTSRACVGEAWRVVMLGSLLCGLFWVTFRGVGHVMSDACFALF